MKGQYGEPWDDKDTNNNIQIKPEANKRAMECVNALDGCPDPKETIQALVFYMQMIAREDLITVTRGLRLDPRLAWIRAAAK